MPNSAIHPRALKAQNLAKKPMVTDPEAKNGTLRPPKQETAQVFSCANCLFNQKRAEDLESQLQILAREVEVKDEIHVLELARYREERKFYERKLVELQNEQWAKEDISEAEINKLNAQMAKYQEAEAKLISVTEELLAKKDLDPHLKLTVHGYIRMQNDELSGLIDAGIEHEMLVKELAAKEKLLAELEKNPQLAIPIDPNSRPDNVVHEISSGVKSTSRLLLPTAASTSRALAVEKQLSDRSEREKSRKTLPKKDKKKGS